MSTIDLDGVQCSLCPAGSIPVEVCTVDNPEPECQVCPVNHYMPYPNLCQECQLCQEICTGKDQIIWKECDGAQKRTCRCINNTYETASGYCQKFKECPAGYRISVKGTPWHDRTCRPCPKGTYSRGKSSRRTCILHTNCTALRKILTRNGNRRRDNECEDIPTSVGKEYTSTVTLGYANNLSTQRGDEELKTQNPSHLGLLTGKDKVVSVTRPTQSPLLAALLTPYPEEGASISAAMYNTESDDTEQSQRTPEESANFNELSDDTVFNDREENKPSDLFKPAPVEHEDTPSSSEDSNDWSDWRRGSECSATCGGGEMVCHRTCNTEDSCEGPKVKSATCNEDPCPELDQSTLPLSASLSTNRIRPTESHSRHIIDLFTLSAVSTITISCIIIVLFVIAGCGFIYWRCRKRKKKRNKYGIPKTEMKKLKKENSGGASEADVDSTSEDEATDTTSTSNLESGTMTNLSRRCLRQGLTMEKDVFGLIARNINREYWKMFLRELPNPITEVDIQDKEERYCHNEKKDELIYQCLLEWKRQNTQEVVSVDSILKALERASCNKLATQIKTKCCRCHTVVTMPNVPPS
ncbi:uncharacterized protein LOC144451485 isoform X2 [Glandiceps talaboti]